ncbi:hypothetical protein ACF0H5_020444 [Mactra antiquata]
MNVPSVCLFLGIAIISLQFSKGYRLPTADSVNEDDNLASSLEEDRSQMVKRQLETQRMARLRYCLSNPNARFDIKCMNNRPSYITVVDQ